MSSLKRQSSWQEDIVRHFSRLFLRSKSQEQEDTGSDENVSSSSVEVPELRSPIQETRTEGHSPELVHDLSKFGGFRGEAEGSVLTDAGGSSLQTTPRSPAGPVPGTPTAPLDAFLRRLGSLFLSPAKVEDRAGDPRHSARLRQQQASEVEPGPAGMTWVSGGTLETRDPTDGPQEGTGTQRPHQEAREHSSEWSAETARPLTAAEPAETEAPTSQTAELTLQERGSSDPKEQRDPNNVASEDDYVAHVEGAASSQHSCRSSDEHRRLALTCPPVVTYGTYRGLSEIEKMRKRHEAQADPPLSETEDRRRDSTPAEPLPLGEQADHSVSGFPAAAARVVDSCQEACSERLERDTFASAGPPVTPTVLSIPVSTLPESGLSQSALPQEREPSLSTAWDLALDFPSRAVPAAIPLADDKDSSDTSMQMCSLDAFGEIEENSATNLGDKIIWGTSVCYVKDTEAEKAPAESASSGRSTGASSTVNDLSPAVARSTLRNVQTRQIATQMEAAASVFRSRQLSQSCMSPLGPQEPEGPEHRGPAGRSTAGSGSESITASTEYLDDVAVERAFHSESKLLVSRILANALTALKKIETSERGNRDLLSDFQPCPVFTGETEEGTDACFQPACIQEESFAGLEEDRLLPIPVEQMASNRSLTDGNRSTQSSGYQSIVGSDTDIRNSSGLTCELYSPVSPPDHRQKEQGPLENEIIKLSFQDGVSLANVNRCLKEFASPPCNSNIEPTILMEEEKQRDAAENKTDKNMTAFSGTLLEKNVIDRDNGDVIHQVNMSPHPDGFSGKFNNDNAHVTQVSEENGLNGQLSTSGNVPVSADLVAKESTESNRQFHNTSSSMENVSPQLDVAQSDVLLENVSKTSVNIEETEITVSTGLGKMLDTKLYHREGEKEQISETALITSKLEPLQRSEEILTRLKDEETRTDSTNIGENLLDDASIASSQQEPHDTLSSGDEKLVVLEGHLPTVTEDETAYKSEGNTCCQMDPEEGKTSSKGENPTEWEKQESHALEPCRNNEGRQWWSAVKAQSNDLPVEHRHNSELPGHGTGANITNSKVPGFNILGKKVQPGLHLSTKSEISGHYLHRFHDVEFHEGDSGISIIDEEEEGDAVFVNDTGVALSPTSRRGKIYPFSLSPIYEEEGNREEVSSDDVREPSVMEEDRDRAEQQASSVLSLLQSVSERLQSSVFADSCQESSEDSSALHRRLFWDCDGDEEGAETAGEDRGFVMNLHGSGGVESQSRQSEHDPANSLYLTDCLVTAAQAEQVSPLQKEKQARAGLSKTMDVASTPFYDYIRCARSEWSLRKAEDCEPRASSFLCRDTADSAVSPVMNIFQESSERVIPRPTQMRIYDGVDFSREERVVHTDMETASGMLYLHGASVRVVRGCWLLYREQGYQGPCVILEEGEVVLTHTTCLSSPENGATAITIGSIRRAVKDDRIPEILLHPQDGASPKHVLSEASSLEDIHLSSLSVKSGCWLAYDGAGFTGSHTILEAGWPLEAGLNGSLVTRVRSLRPLRMGGLKVQRPMDPKMVLYEKTNFNGQNVQLESNMLHVETLPSLQGAASLRVISGVWVGYSKEGYRGQQYLFEEGEYEDFGELGGSDHLLLSFRLLQGDFIEPSVTLREALDLPDATEMEIIDMDVPDLEPVGPARGTASICVNSGLWVAYSERFFCGEQHILERGTYTGFLEWSRCNGPARSIRPIRLDVWTTGGPKFLLRAYYHPHYQGESREFGSEVVSLPPFIPTSFRVVKGCWILFEEEHCAGNQFVLGEGHYPNLISCGSGITSIKSLRPIPYSFAEPSISLYSLDSFEGLEIVALTSREQMDGFFTQSLRVNSGMWVVYEYTGFKGRQMLLGPGDISSWARHSGWDSVGSLNPLRQPKVFVRVRSRSLGFLLTAEDLRGTSPPAAVSLEPDRSLDTQLWVFSGGLLKAKVSKVCLSVIGGKVTPGARVALWPEHGRAHQKWSLNEDGTISSHLDHSLVLDLKGGSDFDKNHLVTRAFTADRITQYWNIEVV